MSDKAADAGPGLDVAKSVGVPDKIVVVNEGVTINHEGEAYGPGDEPTLPGPSAFSLMQQGQVTIKGDA